MLPIQSTSLMSISQTEKQAIPKQERPERGDSFEKILMDDDAPNRDDALLKFDQGMHDPDGPADDTIQGDDDTSPPQAEETSADALAAPTDQSVPKVPDELRPLPDGDLPDTKHVSMIEGLSETSGQDAKNHAKTGDVDVDRQQSIHLRTDVPVDQKATLSLGELDGAGHQISKLATHPSQSQVSMLQSTNTSEKALITPENVKGLVPQSEGADVTRGEVSTTLVASTQTSFVTTGSGVNSLQNVTKTSENTPKNLSLEQFEASSDVTVRRIDSPSQETVKPRIPTHPIQAMLHAQMATVTQPAIMRAAIDSGKEGITGLGEVTFGGDAGLDAKPLPSTQLHLPVRAEATLPVPRQIVDAMRVLRNGGTVIEVALSPAELGNVRMTMAASDAGMVVSILADRPETLDLLRRNIAELNQSFSEMGYEDISFSFEQDGSDTNDGMSGGSANQDAPQPQISGIETATISSQPTLTPLAHSASGVDIRL